MNDNFTFEWIKAERDKCLIETIKECALHPDKRKIVIHGLNSS